jgi:trehalose 6-phosphate phosphatase
VKSLLSPEGRSALAGLASARNPLFAFDFDGTLAPIVTRPDDAQIPLPVARRLGALTSRRTVAVVTGRSVVDVNSRLGFAPKYVVGNHGAEGVSSSQAEAWARTLDPLRSTLRAAKSQLSACGVRVEDKGLSIALHYRTAADEVVARAAIDAVLRGLGHELTVVGGKCVVNVVVRAAPDKGDALLALASESGADAGLFLGDDDNDEPAFAKLPPHWVTVRMGPDFARSRAAFYLDGPSQMATLLQILLDFHRPP